MPIPSVEHRRLRAAGEGQADDTDALQSAIDACAGEGGTVTVPSGTYVTGTLRIGSHTELSLATGATRQVQLHLTAACHWENNLKMARRDLVTDDSYDLVIDGGKSSEEESRSAADLRREAYPGAPR